MAQDMRDREYSQYQDSYDRWRDERDYARQDMQLEREQAYETAMLMLQLGQMPTQELLQAAGLSTGDAGSIVQGVKTKQYSGGGSSASSVPDLSGLLMDEETLAADETGAGWTNWNNEDGSRMNREQKVMEIYNAVETGKMSQEEAVAELRWLGIEL